jgi:hypothetical protein
MNFRIHGAFAAALILTACTAEPKRDPADPKSYDVSLTVTPAEGAATQLLPLPAQVLVAAKHDDLRDVRVFDGRGKTLPIARVSPSDKQSNAATVATVPVYALDATGNVQGDAKVTIRIDNSTTAQSVGVETAGSGASANGGAALIDVRKIEHPVFAIDVKADLPKQKPVTVVLEASENLKDWQTLGEKVLLRPGGEPTLLGTSMIEFPATSLRNHYVRARWDAAGVKLLGASASSAKASQPQLLAIPASSAAFVNAHEVRFDLPLVANPHAIRLTQTAPDGVIPLTLSAQEDQTQDWRMVSLATSRQQGRAALLTLPTQNARAYRIEADKRTSGFSAVPKIELLYQPKELLVAFNGVPPYTLRAGNAGASGTSFLDLNQIVPNGVPQDIKTAKVEVAQVMPVISIAPGEEGGAKLGRKSVLWLVLLLGTAVLGFALYRLMRAAPAAPEPDATKP